MIGSAGVLLWSLGDDAPDWAKYLQFALYSIGTYGSRLWTACLAVTLLFLQCRSLCFVLRLWPYFVTIGWAMPVLIVAVLMIYDSSNLAPHEKRNPSFQYGNAQAAIAIFILVMCFIVTVGCLVLHQRYRKRHERYVVLSKEVEQSTASTVTMPRDDDEGVETAGSSSNDGATVLENNNLGDLEAGQGRRRKLRKQSPKKMASSSNSSSADFEDVEATGGSGGCGGDNGGGVVNQCCSLDSETGCGGVSQAATATGRKADEIVHRKRVVVDIEDLFSAGGGNGGDVGSAETTTACDLNSPTSLCSSQFNCGSSRDACESRVEDYRAITTADALEPADLEDASHNCQVTKHTVLLILLLCSMFVGLALSIWTLVLDGMSGIYIELAFLDAFLNYGQSLVVMAVFVGDLWELLMPLSRFWRQMWSCGNVALNLPAWEDLDEDTRLICERFVNHHLANCRQAIACDRRWRIRVYRNCFHGGQFVDWLVEVGLANDRVEAVKYAKRLVDGRVLRHITNRQHFYDKTYLYTFCERL